MKKRTKAEILTALGTPFMLSLNMLHSSMSDKTPFRFFASLPFTVLTLPFSFFAFHGSNAMQEYEKEEFEQRTAHLPRVRNLPEDHAYIYQVDKDEFILTPQYYLNPDPMAYCTYPNDYSFFTEQDARVALVARGYQESIVENLPNHYLWGTVWVKQPENKNED